jgi:hypothetical protein
VRVVVLSTRRNMENSPFYGPNLPEKLRNLLIYQGVWTMKDQIKFILNFLKEYLIFHLIYMIRTYVRLPLL